MSEHFTRQEWEICIKVLTALKDDPLDNPDNDTFKTLITKIHKNARKGLRKESYAQKREEDMQILSASAIVSNALHNTSTYSADEIRKENCFTTLHLPRNCYVCNSQFDKAHFFYSKLCPVCAEYNYQKRFEMVDLSGRKAILTGGRVKIGYSTAVKLLQCGAELILTTRFPALALEQLSKEKEYSKWKERLTIYGLDLRNLKAVEEFIGFVNQKFDCLDILINNAAQTIQYPPEYYLPLITNEQLVLKQSLPNLIANSTPVTGDVKLLGIGEEPVEFQTNRFGQPVDERMKNSWNSRLEEVSLYELLEVNLINHISPYMLIKELKPLFLKSGFDKRFIVNVTSSEGQFSYKNKTIFHPHTNMTKAALNMMTCTSAVDFASYTILMNSVDVGWVSTGAHEKLREKQFERGNVPPLDSVDGAARILHPIAESLFGNDLYGKLLKNYKVVNW